MSVMETIMNEISSVLAHVDRTSLEDISGRLIRAPRYSWLAKDVLG
jgi:hypothetical protein